MSLIDDQAAEVEAQLDRAQQKLLHGRRYSPAFELARDIKVLRKILSQRPKGKPHKGLHAVKRKLMTQAGDILVRAAITSSDKLREVADALDAEQRPDARQANILRAYAACIVEVYPPTLAELKRAFVARFGLRSWGTDFAVRKTVKKTLRLPLRDDVLGRPRGSRSIRNR